MGEKTLSLENFLSLDCLEFSNIGWKKKPEVDCKSGSTIAQKSANRFLQTYNQGSAKRVHAKRFAGKEKTRIHSAGLFFHHFSLDSSQFKLKKFSKLKVFSPKNRIFLLNSREIPNFPHQSERIFR